MAGEGSFIISRLSRRRTDGISRLKFAFCVEVARQDRALLEALRSFIGFGSIRDIDARKDGWHPTSVHLVNSIKGHLLGTIPFAERYLLPCAKRAQFEDWRAQLLAYVETYNIRSGRGPSRCSRDGCSGVVRGRGLCRRHYYHATGW